MSVEFKLGDKVRRKKEHRDSYWKGQSRFKEKPEDHTYTITHVFGSFGIQLDNHGNYTPYKFELVKLKPKKYL